MKMTSYKSAKLKTENLSICEYFLSVSKIGI